MRWSSLQLQAYVHVTPFIGSLVGIGEETLPVPILDAYTYTYTSQSVHLVWAVAMFCTHSSKHALDMAVDRWASNSAQSV